MSILTHSKIFTGLLRLFLVFICFFLFFLSFRLLLALSRPSQYLGAYQSVIQGPGKSVDLQKMGMLNIRQCLYLYGRVLNAANLSSHAALFVAGRSSLAEPSVFSDRWGAVEVVCPNIPYTLSKLSAFHYQEPLHMLGWREGPATFSILALAKSKAELVQLMDNQTHHWKITFFIQSLTLALSVFFFLGLSAFLVLRKWMVHWFFVLVINGAFGLVFFSVSISSSYPLLLLWPQILSVFAISNLLFLGVASGILWLKKHRARGGI